MELENERCHEASGWTVLSPYVQQIKETTARMCRRKPMKSCLYLCVFLLTCWVCFWYVFTGSTKVSRLPSKTLVLPKIRFAARKSKGNTRIPSIIHQTWARPTDVPLIFKNWIQTWITQNEDFEYWFWDDEDIRRLVETNYPDYLQLFDSYPSSGYRADAFRYFVLYEHGGIYADLDSECLKPIQPITEIHSCILAQEPLEHAHFLGPLGVPLVSNAIMACERRHPFFASVIANLHRHTGWRDWADILHATGPYMLTKRYRWTSNNTVASLPDLAEPETFLPTIDESMVDRIREMCTYPSKRGESIWTRLLSTSFLRGAFNTTGLTEKLCLRMMGFQFSNTPTERSYTNHHWTHTWATKLHDPWGVKNWRVFFNMEELRPKGSADTLHWRAANVEANLHT